MISEKGTFDGKELILSEKIIVIKPTRVIVTFLEDIEESSEEFMILADKGGAFDFLNDPEEDIYTDENLKKKYR